MWEYFCALLYKVGMREVGDDTRGMEESVAVLSENYTIVHDMYLVDVSW